ncbi:MAG: CBS domain-containing protein [Candidatus Latescibacteria bacterium]|nr:CBS domain-containing protein [Candidatus Latescibacterota bacterium]
MASVPAPVLCLACGHENIAGVDACAECGHSLVREEHLEGEHGHNALTQTLQVLKPRRPECLPRSASLAEAVTLLKGRNVGCVLISDAQGRLVGIFTERDVLYRVAGLIEDLDPIPIESLMTPRPTTLKITDTVDRALHLMGLHGFRHVPLVDEQGRPVGIISFRDIVCYIEESFARTP